MSEMNIRVLAFAGLKEHLKFHQKTIDLPDDSRLRDAVVAVTGGETEAQSIARYTLFAVNQRYAPPSTPLRDGDEVALIPPVAGG